MNTAATTSHIMDDVALIYGFSIKNGAATSIQGGVQNTDDQDYMWCHVNLASEAGIHWVKSHSNLPPQLISAFCNREEETDVLPFGTGLLVAVKDRLKAFGDAPLELGNLHMWIEPNRIITARWHPLVAPDRLRFRLQVGSAPETSVGLAIAMLDEIVKDIENIGDKIIQNIDELEDRVLDNDQSRIAADIGLARRQIIRMRRQVLPLRLNITRAAKELPKWATVSENESLDSLLSRIERIGSEIVEAQEQARVLQDESGARSAENINRSMYVLTLFTVIILPLNLITGYFGMNVQGLPGVGVDGGFEWVTASMVITLVVTVLFFKWKRWF